MRYQHVVVGVDGSGPARAAVRWAAAEAGRRGTGLRVLAAYQVPTRSARLGDVGELKRLAREQCEALIAEAVDQARIVAPAVAVTGEIVLGDAAAELVGAGGRYDLVVVGSRGHGGFGGLLLGSVGQRVATHAPVPVVVVRGRADAASGPVVVGVDDAPSMDRVMEAGFEAARRYGASLVAVHAYVVPVGSDDAAVRGSAAELVIAAVAPWRDKYPTVPVVMLIKRGSPAGVLAAESTTAALVVVGSHGHGVLAGTLLGSVGMQLLHHADAPVMIVH